MTKVAVVTGGGSGIGKAVACRLADEGFDVVAVGRSLEKLDAMRADYRGKGKLSVRAADVADPAVVAELVRDVQHAFGHIEVLVNNAGVNAKLRALPQLTLEEWDRQLRINLTGSFQMILAVLPGMRERSNGLIVNISSISAMRPSSLAGAAYSAAKAGVNALSSVVSQEEGKNGVRSTVICPGEVDTPILEVRPEPISAERRAVILQPEDVAEAVAFVVKLSPRAHVPELVIKPTVHSWQ
jgi:NADP-dependent 3-hydroxy acid dehydrogenase YdfG